MPGNVAAVEGERANLHAYLTQQRYAIRLTAYGLTDEQARATPTASSLSVGGLIKHVTAMERNWMDIVLQRTTSDGPDVDKYRDDFTLGADETLQAIIDDNVRCGIETDMILADIADLGQPVPVPKGVPWFPDDVEAWSVRWVLLHVIEEIARHAGHADIIREHIDGGTMYPIMAAAEDWPESPWMQRWKPSGELHSPSPATKEH
ncbi:MAG: DinB family protein [Ilumatobacteraceae bacterium]